jgi:hypothetical protein
MSAVLLDVAVSRGTRNRLAVFDRVPARHWFEVTLVPGKLVWSCHVTRTAAKSSFFAAALRRSSLKRKGSLARSSAILFYVETATQAQAELQHRS